MKWNVLSAVVAVLALSTPSSLASWPKLSCEIAKMRPGGTEESAFKALLASKRHVTVGGFKFYSIDISKPDDSNWITCDFQISASQVVDWYSMEYTRSEGVGLVPPLENENQQRSGELQYLTTLLAIVQSLDLRSSYSHTRISSSDGRQTYANSNYLRVSVKREDVKKLYLLAMTYMKALDAKVQINVYEFN